MGVGGRSYYACRLRLDGHTVSVVWYSADVDGFLRDRAGRMVVARTPEGLAAAARAAGIELEDDESTDFDFDRIREWCVAPDPAAVDCAAFLNAWNFLDDLSGLHAGADTPYTRLSRAAEGPYDALFRGNNLPALTPPGERFVPAWTAEDVAAIRGVMAAGVELLSAELRAADGTGPISEARR